MVIWPLPRLDPGAGGGGGAHAPSGAWGWSPKREIDSFWLVTCSLPGQEGCGGPRRVGELSGRWRCQVPETLSDHLRNEAEVLDLGELLQVGKDEQSRQVRS